MSTSHCWRLLLKLEVSKPNSSCLHPPTAQGQVCDLKLIQSPAVWTLSEWCKKLCSQTGHKECNGQQTGFCSTAWSLLAWFLPSFQAQFPSPFTFSYSLSNTFPPKSSQSQFLFLHQESSLIDASFSGLPYHTVDVHIIIPVTYTVYFI